MAGHKISLFKSEVVVLGCPEVKPVRIANLLNCKLGSIPMNYLGIPVVARKLLAINFFHIVHKVGQRVHPWGGKLPK